MGWAWAGPGYFETLQIPLLYGRTFTQFDRPETPDVAVINEGMARRYFGRLNAVGGRFRVAEAPDTAEGAAAAAGFEVIGVVPDIRTSVFEEPRPLFYRSSRQAAASTSTMLVRTALDPGSLLQQMRQTVRDLDSQVPVLSARTMTQYVDDELGGARQVGAALGGLGALGLGLASLGLYAVMALAVSRRTREIGIRRALGAQWTQVIWTVSRGVADPARGRGDDGPGALVAERQGVGRNVVQPVSRWGCQLVGADCGPEDLRARDGAHGRRRTGGHVLSRTACRPGRSAGGAAPAVGPQGCGRVIRFGR